MSYRFVKHKDAIGWDWYLIESDDCSSWVSPFVKEVIETLEAENAKLRELVRGLIYATHPADRARLIADAVELEVVIEHE